MRVRSKYFIVSGAMGGFVGFVLMELTRAIFPGGVSSWGDIVALAFQFSAFGLAVGAALGMTEGFVRKKKWRLIYGLTLGLALGAAGGFAGGAAGQTIFSLLPKPAQAETARTDVAIALDSSGSMRSFFFFGSDPRGLRRDAAQKLVDLLGLGDRVAIIGFNHTSSVLQPLTRLESNAVRRQVKKAIKRIGNDGGTNLDAGLASSIEQLVAAGGSQNGSGESRTGRTNESQKSTDGGGSRKVSQYVIFLTDGMGEYHSSTIEPALAAGIKIYTIGLGNGVNRELLESIATPTGGQYFPVEKAEDLWKTFERIYKENINIDMASHQGDGETGADPFLLFLLRALSWGAMGVVIGAGQGVRENTREDLKACTLGGLAGGLVGGVLFNPMTDLIRFGSGIFGRWMADVVVGACIGGSMRVAQIHLVELKDKRTTSLLTILPEKKSSLVVMPGSPQPNPPGAQGRTGRVSGKLVSPRGFKGLVLQMKNNVEERPVGPRDPGEAPPEKLEPPPATPPSASGEELLRPPPTGRRKPLSFYESRYSADRPRAMAAAFQSGHYSIEDIAEHFGVQPGRVARAVRHLSRSPR